MRLVAISALLLAAACGNPGVTWERPGATQADVDRDEYECRKEAYATGGVHVGYGIIERTMNVDVYGNCMIARGYNHRG